MEAPGRLSPKRHQSRRHAPILNAEPPDPTLIAAMQVLEESQSYWNPLFRIDNGPEARYTGHATRITTDFALDFIEANQTGPFFASVWYFAPHAPLEPPEPWASRYPDTLDGRYAEMWRRQQEARDRGGEFPEGGLVTC